MSAPQSNPPTEEAALDRLSQQARQTLQRLTSSEVAPEREKPSDDDSLTIEDIRNLPTTIDVVTAGKALGIGRTKAYELAKRGEFPCRVIPLSEPDTPGQRRVYRVPTAELLRLLGINAPASVRQGPSAGDSQWGRG